jgi:hypothetical protein
LDRRQRQLQKPLGFFNYAVLFPQTNYKLTARRQQKLAEAHLRDFQRGIISRAMAEKPADWSDELKAAVTRAGWDLAGFTKGIHQRQEAAAQGRDVDAVELNSLFQLNTAVENASWGQLKEDISDSQ